MEIHHVRGDVDCGDCWAGRGRGGGRSLGGADDPAGGGKPVPEQYIVVLAAHVTEPLATVAPQLANKYGGKVRQTWEPR